jgi:transposase
MSIDQLSEVQSNDILMASSGARLVSHLPETRTAPDPEVSEKAKRRQFTAKYKRRVLQELDRCSEPGQVGALLRREGLYSSHLSKWRAQREAGLLQALAPKKRGHKPAERAHALIAENQRLRQENERLKHRLDEAETIVEFQKKVAALFGLPSRIEKQESH